MRNFVLGFLGALLILPLAGIAYLVFGFSKISADAQPYALETAILQSAVRASVRRSASAIPNPPAADQESLVAGGKLYVAGCQGCHGDLSGAYRQDRDHFPRVPQLPHFGTRYSEPELYWLVKHGIRMTGMSAYGPFYSEKKLWSMAAFLRQIDKLPPGVMEKILSKKAERSVMDAREE